MEFLVMSRWAVEDDFRACFITKPHINVSFHDPDLKPAKLPKNKARKGKIFIGAHDIDLRHEAIVKGEEKYTLFTEEMATQILDFIDSKIEKLELIVVNCEAGISRSRGCACALAKILNNKDDAMFNQGCPNMKIYNTILMRYFGEPNYHLRWKNIWEVRKRSLPSVDSEIFSDEDE